jgi:acetamidase/formamidase
MGQGYSEDEAITLMSVAADFGITQVPDRVNQCQPRHASVSSSLSPRFGLVPSLCPAVAHMSSSQVVDGNWGAHVVIPKHSINEKDIPIFNLCRDAGSSRQQVLWFCEEG